VSEIIDTPAQGFPLPTMNPPTRSLRDVAARLTAGSKARAVQRAENIAVGTAYLDGGDLPTMHHTHPCGLVPSVLDGEIARRLEVVSDPMSPHLDAWRDVTRRVADGAREQQEEALRAAFNAGRAYERGATLRRGSSAKSFVPRRVQAQGIASDYLRNDPQDGARHAALVLAGFLGHAPETVR
jgi:hypothetical protein